MTDFEMFSRVSNFADVKLFSFYVFLLLKYMLKSTYADEKRAFCWKNLGPRVKSKRNITNLHAINTNPIVTNRLVCRDDEVIPLTRIDDNWLYRCWFHLKKNNNFNIWCLHSQEFYVKFETVRDFEMNFDTV